MGFERPHIIIGHRGAAGLLPENTLPSFERAIELGVDAVELDVHVCEGRLCVIHDPTLDRTTSGTGPVAGITLAALRALDAGNGAQVPLLEEVFELVPDSVGVNVELKGEGTAEVLARLLRPRGAYHRRELLVSSFDHAALARFHELRPAVPVAPLFSRWRADGFDIARRLGSGFVNLGVKIATAARCRAAHKAGLETLVYTINDPAEARRLFELGVKGLFTDYPDRIRPGAPGDRVPGRGGTSRR